MALTPSQRAAVVYDQNLILFAGPGSGKTATAVAKADRILSRPDTRLCLVTFTVAAAGEMQRRTEVAFASNGRQFPKQNLICGTFNSLSLRHFQKHTKIKEKLLGPPARSAMINTMLAHLPLDDKTETILALERYQGALNPETIALSSGHAKFIDEYLSKMRAAKATDLATVMRECTHQMGTGQIPLLPVTHLLGDEMQDADEVQLEFMLHHGRAGVITTLVADDDQTIYEWRSALGYVGLQRFAQEAKAKTITLSENFRSRDEIVAHAKQLIVRNDPDRIEKDQVAVRGPGGALVVVASSHLEAECDLVANAIHEHPQDRGTVAILARSNRALDTMEEGLSIYGVPYRRDGRSIWDSTEICIFVSLMRALLSSASADLLPVLMLLDLDGRTRNQLEREIGGHCGDFLDGSLADLSHATPLDKAELTRFTQDTSTWRKRLRKGEINLTLPDIKDATRDLIRAHANESPEDQSSKMRRINFLLDTALNVLSNMKGSLSHRLNTISRIQAKAPDADTVRLMTMHSSKGLEFDTVFLINAKKPDDGSTLMNDHPERRLFYVAMTRAKERFAATYSDTPVKFIHEAGLPVSQSLHDLFGSH